MLSWNIASVEDINEETLSLFFILDPKIEVLVLGIGDNDSVTTALSARINAVTRKHKINVEVLGTETVCKLLITCNIFDIKIHFFRL